MKPTIRIVNGVTRHPDFRFAEPVNLEIMPTEHVAIIGPNACGKSRLVDIIRGRYPLIAGGSIEYDFSPSPLKLVSENIKYISFRDSYGDADASYYYQQRWNQHDIDPSTPTVGDLLEQAFAAADTSTGYGLDDAQKREARQKREAMRRRLHDMFRLDDLADRYVISLSSGELRKFQLTRALYGVPRILILEAPFIGLDAKTREALARLLEDLSHEVQIILVLATGDYVPGFINRTIQPPSPARPHRREGQRIHPSPAAPPQVKLPTSAGEQQAILSFNSVTVRYGSRTILKDLTWQVCKGENWALMGDNGSGKSTLLSLVCADNPQAYACDISLFGRRRGSGESIWEIKRHIGYVSPEMHRAYMRDMPAIDIVASGLHDSVGLYLRPKPEQRQQCICWMQRFGIAHLADRTFLKLSSGEQRLILVCRAFVKNPDLLILDEPLHGLDGSNREMVRRIIHDYCAGPDVTLIMVTHYPEELPDNITHRLTLPKNQ